MTTHHILGQVAPVESLGRATLEAIEASGGCSISAELAGINARGLALAAQHPADPEPPWPNGEIRLWDSQWVNIVNGDCANPALDRVAAVSLAIKLTEQAMRKNYEAELTTRRARDAEVEALVAAAKQGLRAMDDARDAIQPITGAQMKLHRLNPLTADNLDSAAEAMQSALAPFTGAKP